MELLLEAVGTGCPELMKLLVLRHVRIFDIARPLSLEEAEIAFRGVFLDRRSRDRVPLLLELLPSSFCITIWVVMNVSTTFDQQPPSFCFRLLCLCLDLGSFYFLISRRILVGL